MHIPSEKLDVQSGDAQIKGLFRSHYEPVDKMKPRTPFNEFLNLIMLEKSTLVSHKIQRVIKYVERHTKRKINLKYVAGLIGVHPNHLSRKFKEEVGLSFHEYIVTSRIQKAVCLLAYTEKSIKEISYEIGYTRPEMFTKAFKRLVRFSPKKFRKLYRYGLAH